MARTAFSLIAALGIGVWSIGAAEAANLEAGAERAQTWCSGCHLVSPEQTGEVPAGVPTFMSLANDPERDEADLRTFLHAPHPPMPALELSRRQIDDLVAYIESLAQP